MTTARKDAHGRYRDARGRFCSTPRARRSFVRFAQRAGIYAFNAAIFGTAAAGFAVGLIALAN